MSLYNAKHTPEGIRITKFTEDLDVESSYITSTDACDCPAGHKHTCRHRQMLPLFQHRINTPWFLEYDNNEWFYYHAEAGQFLKNAPRPKWRRI